MVRRMRTVREPKNVSVMLTEAEIYLYNIGLDLIQFETRKTVKEVNNESESSMEVEVEVSEISEKQKSSVDEAANENTSKDKVLLNVIEGSMEKEATDDVVERPQELEVKSDIEDVTIGSKVQEKTDAAAVIEESKDGDRTDIVGNIDDSTVIEKAVIEKKTDIDVAVENTVMEETIVDVSVEGNTTGKNIAEVDDDDGHDSIEINFESFDPLLAEAAPVKNENPEEAEVGEVVVAVLADDEEMVVIRITNIDELVQQPTDANKYIPTQVMVTRPTNMEKFNTNQFMEIEDLISYALDIVSLFETNFINYHMANRDGHQTENRFTNHNFSRLSIAFHKLLFKLLFENPWKCFYCNLGIQENYSFRWHCGSEYGKAVKNFGKRKVPCVFCKKTVNRRQSLGYRGKHVISTNRITCKLCYVAFGGKGKNQKGKQNSEMIVCNFKCHLSLYNDSLSMITCHNCDNKFERKSMFHEHMEHSTEKRKTVKMRRRRRRKEEVREFALERMVKEPDTLISDRYSDLFECFQFLKTFFCPSDEIICHYLKELVEENFDANIKDYILDQHARRKCNPCIYVTPRMENKRRHMSFTHQGVHWPCNLCKYRAHVKGFLMQHKRGVHERSKFHCNLYSYSVSPNEKLKKHVEIKCHKYQYLVYLVQNRGMMGLKREVQIESLASSLKN